MFNEDFQDVICFFAVALSVLELWLKTTVLLVDAEAEVVTTGASELMTSATSTTHAHLAR